MPEDFFNILEVCMKMTRKKGGKERKLRGREGSAPRSAVSKRVYGLK
jgi:hypothetical protein